MDKSIGVSLVFGVSKAVTDTLGIRNDLVQSVDLHFSNDAFATADIQLVQDAGETLQKALDGCGVVLCAKPQ